MILKETPESSSFIQAGSDYSQIASGPNSITTTRDAGNFINGPISFTSPPTAIRFGGVFKFNPLIATMIPSTIATPIPTLQLDLPIKNIGTMASIATLIKSVL